MLQLIIIWICQKLYGILISNVFGVGIHKPRGQILGILPPPSLRGHFYQVRINSIAKGSKVVICLTPSPHGPPLNSLRGLWEPPDKNSLRKRILKPCMQE